MNIDKAFPSRYLKCGDLDGREIVVTIKEVKLENVGQTKESKPVVYFRGATKGMVLNRTNSKRIEAIAGSPDTDDWTGCRIKLYPTETEFAGEVVECVRVKSPDSKKKPVIEPEPVKAKPAKKVKEPAKPVEPEPDDPFPAQREPGDESEVEAEAAADEDDEDSISF